MSPTPTVGVVLAAGSGTRLQPLTLTRPKPLLPVAGRLLLDYNLEKLAAAGATHAVIITPGGDHSIAQAVGPARFGMAISFIPQPQPKGTGHALSLTRPLISGAFFVMFCDNITPWDLTRLRAQHQATAAVATLALFHAEDPGKHGIVEIEAGRILRLVEKPEHPATDLASAGMFVLEPEIFSVLDDLAASHGETHIVDGVQRLINRGRTASYCLLDAWRINVNKPENLLLANSRLLAAMAPDARKKAAIGERCHIHPTASVAADVSMGSGCAIMPGAVLRDSILLAQVHIGSGARVQRCLLGEGSRVEDGVSLKNLVLGDGECAAKSLTGPLL